MSNNLNKVSFDDAKAAIHRAVLILRIYPRLHGKGDNLDTVQDLINNVDIYFNKQSPTSDLAKIVLRFVTFYEKEWHGWDTELVNEVGAFVDDLHKSGLLGDQLSTDSTTTERE